MRMRVLEEKLIVENESSGELRLRMRVLRGENEIEIENETPNFQE